MHEKTETAKLKNVKPNRKIVNLTILAVITALIGLTVIALSGFLTFSLWGLVALATLVLLARLFAPENIWFAAKSKAIDVAFLTALIIVLLATIPYVNLPSPV